VVTTMIPSGWRPAPLYPCVLQETALHCRYIARLLALYFQNTLLGGHSAYARDTAIGPDTEVQDDLAK
jgi:hypothetical protein